MTIYEGKVTNYKTNQLACVATDDENGIGQSVSSEYGDPNDKNADKCYRRYQLDNDVLTEF
jgi:hypothetical protein